jgi:hypothetical protein
MASSVVQTLLSNVIIETQIEALIAFKEFACKQDDVDDEFVSHLVNQFISKMRKEFKSPKTKCVTVGRKKRNISAYSLFMQYLMKDEDFKNKAGNGKMLMTQAVQMWKSLDESVRERMNILHKQKPHLSGKELFESVTISTQ